MSGKSPSSPMSAALDLSGGQPSVPHVSMKSGKVWTFGSTALKIAGLAVFAFLLFGPVFDLKLFWLYSLIFRPRFVVVLAIGLFVSIAFVCWRIAPFLSVSP